MPALGIIVSFAIGTSDAVYCTKPLPLAEAQAQLTQMAPSGDFSAWRNAHPGFTTPGIIVRGHPNYNDALNGKIEDDPTTGDSKTIPPCQPFPNP